MNSGHGAEAQPLAVLARVAALVRAGSGVDDTVQAALHENCEALGFPVAHAFLVAGGEAAPAHLRTSRMRTGSPS